MLIEVKVPVLPESITEATLVNWHKKAGDTVRRDENLVDVETDKVVLELPAPDSGVLAELRKGDGSTVAAEEVIAVIDTDGKGAKDDKPAAPSVPTGAAASAPPGEAKLPSSSGAIAMPAARKLMAEQNIADVAGTGRGGRITKGDVLAAAEAKAKASPVPPLSPPAPPPVARAPAPQ